MANGYQSSYQSKRRLDEAAIYIFARCEQLLADYARSTSLPEGELAVRVGGLFQAQTRGTILGPQHRLSSLSGAGAGDSIRTRALALARGSHRGTQVGRPDLTEDARERIAAAQRRRWAKNPNRSHHGPSTGYSYNGTHWTQNPKNRAKMMKVYRAGLGKGKHRPPNLTGYSYNGTHWTQQPKNKARLKRQMRVTRSKALAQKRS